MPSIKFLPTFPERPTNPARTNVRTGDIEINGARWAGLSPEEQEFTLLHEVGHYKLKTFDEVEADRYALQHLAGKKPYSLVNYLNAVSNISYNNPRRVSCAQYDTLRIAANKGSERAKKLLQSYAAADGAEPVQESNRWLWTLVLILGIGILLLIAETKGL